MKLIALSLLLCLPSFGQSTATTDSDPSYRVTSTNGAGSIANYKPATAKQRAQWYLNTTIGPARLFIVGPISSGWGTLRDIPSEYGTHWDGFGKRNGMRLTGVATGNLIEAGMGALWGEDPRYFRSPEGWKFAPRAKYVVKTTFLAPHRDGRFHLAYARFAGNVGNNFLSNTWRADSEANTRDALVRCVWGMLGRMTSDAFEEFWPDIKRKVLRR